MDIKELKHKIALDSARIYTEHQCQNLTSNERLARDDQFITLHNVYIMEVYLKAYKKNLDLLESDDKDFPRRENVMEILQYLEKKYKEDE